MTPIELATVRLVQACEGNPIATTIVVMLFCVMFSLLEATFETLVFGHRFEHFVDLIFQLAFIAYAAYAVYWCALFQQAQSAIAKKKGDAA